MANLVKAVSASNNHFSNALHKELEIGKPVDENLIFSPYSLVNVLSQVKAGSRAETADQLKKVLQLPENDSDLHNGFKMVIETLEQKENSDYTLSTGNRLFSMTGFKIKEEFMNVLSNSYKSSIAQVDFSKNVETAEIINSWVESETNKRIQNLISPDALNGLTRLVLVNAIYFKGFWKTKFRPENTYTGTFSIEENNEMQVPLMHLNNKKFDIGQLDDGQTQVISLPYQGDRLTMLVYLNLETFTGPNPLDQIDRPSLVMSKLSRQSVNLTLPKFKLETTISLVETLNKLGLTDMFDQNKADLSGIAEDKLYVSEVVQKAFIEVNEEGSEAAASTGMMIELTCMPILVDFHVTRPFYFQIVDLSTDFVLFQGKCNNPLRS